MPSMDESWDEPMRSPGGDVGFAVAVTKVGTPAVASVLGGDVVIAVAATEIGATVPANIVLGADVKPPQASFAPTNPTTAIKTLNLRSFIICFSLYTIDVHQSWLRLRPA